MIDKKWVLGWNDRGLGHGDYFVGIDAPLKMHDMVIPSVMPVIADFGLSRELCEHIIDIHNESILKPLAPEIEE